MEKAPSVEVFKVWPKLSEEQRLHLVDEIVRIEKAALEHPLPGYGSIFFHRDLWPTMPFMVVDDTFTIGPSLDRSFWNDKREPMDIDRGPCENMCMSFSPLLIPFQGAHPPSICLLCVAENSNGSDYMLLCRLSENRHDIG
jgi:hypothetical protein